MDEVSRFFNSLPPVTRVIFTGALVVPLLETLSILPARYIVFDLHSVFYRLELWRLVTSLFYFPTSFSWLIMLLQIFQNSKSLEETSYGNKPGEYLFFVLFVSVVTMVLGSLFGMSIFLPSVVMGIIYLWSQHNRDVTVQIYMFRLKGAYLWMGIVAFDFVINSKAVALMDLLGVVAAHSFYFLMYIYPAEYGRPILRTPAVLDRFMENYRIAPAARSNYMFQAPRPTAANATDERPRQGGYTWGSGRRLDD